VTAVLQLQYVSFKLVIGWLRCFKLFFVNRRRNFMNTFFLKIPFFLFVIQKPKVRYVSLKSVTFYKLNKVDIILGIYKTRKVLLYGFVVPFSKIQNPGNITIVAFGKMVVGQIVGAGVVVEEIGGLAEVL
jgi:hypothetical protein